MWSVDAVVGENGAFYFYYDRARKKLAQRFLFDAPARAANREKLVAVRERILREVPACALASGYVLNYCEQSTAWDRGSPGLRVAGHSAAGPPAAGD